MQNQPTASPESHNIIVVKATQHVDNSICLAYVTKELVAKSLTLRGTLNKSGNVDNLASSWNNTARMNYLGKLGKALIGHCDYAYIRLNCTEGEVGCLCLCVGEAVEECGLSHVRESYDTAF